MTMTKDKSAKAQQTKKNIIQSAEELLLEKSITKQIRLSADRSWINRWSFHSRY